MTSPYVTAMPPAGQLTALDREFYLEAFLQRWDCENTRRGYRDDMNALTGWCAANNLELFSLHRIHLEVFTRPGCSSCRSGHR